MKTEGSARTPGCPYCGYVAVDAADEIAHMNAEHPDVIAERLAAIDGVPMERGPRFQFKFGEDVDDPGPPYGIYEWRPTARQAAPVRLRELADDLERYEEASEVADDLSRAIAIELLEVAMDVLETDALQTSRAGQGGTLVTTY